MANAKKCDRCGKLFEPYNIDEGHKVPSRYMNILLRNALIDQSTYKEPHDYDLCKECNDSFLKWLSKPSVVNRDPSCLMERECKVANKKKGIPKCFGKFYENNCNCLLCELADKCKEKNDEE